jgi:hypothetical protein
MHANNATYFFEEVPGIRVTYSDDCQRSWLTIQYVVCRDIQYANGYSIPAEFVMTLTKPYNPDDRR